MGTNILKGPDYHMEFPNESLGKLFYDGLSKYKGQPALIDEYSGETLTYDDVLEITCQLARVYENIGLKAGDRIAIYSENSVYYFLPMIAALYLGIVTVPISHYYLKGELDHALNLTKPSVLFCSKRNYREFLKIRELFGFVKYVIVTDFEEIWDGVENFATMFGKYGNGDGDVQLRECDIAETVALILFSSGTTGLPKGVQLTHKNYISRMVHSWDPRLKYYDPDDAVLGFLPFYHASGAITYTGALLKGAVVRVFWQFRERDFLRAVQDYRVRMLPIVPSIAVFLAKSPVVDEYDLSAVKEVFAGGAAFSESTERRLVERLRLRSVRQVYGMTETTLNVTCVPVGDAQKRGSSGKLVPGMAAAVRDPDSGRLLGPRLVGEVVVRGDMVMAGYFGDRRATDEAFLADGFLRTGDLAFYDEDGHFFVVDRLKDLIKYNAFQVAPAELESLLLKHPKVLDAGVVGVPDERAGELPMAFVVKQPDAQDLTAEEIIKYVSENVSHQKRLRGGVIFTDTIPKNASGKILRRELRKRLPISGSKSKL